jgi:uncharacterized protein
MRLSEDRVSHLARIVVDRIWNDDLVEYSNEEQALRSAKKGLQEHADMMVEIDNQARAKVASLKRGVMEGSPEWDILYSKYFEEEIKRRGQS